MASPEIREEMKDIAGKRRRFGYRRIGVLLERKGMIMNHKKLYRLYREGGGGGRVSAVVEIGRWRNLRVN